MLLELQLLFESSLLARHLRGTTGGVELLRRVVDGADVSEVQAAELGVVEIHVAQVHVHGHARDLVVVLVLRDALLGRLLASLGHALLRGQGRRVDGGDGRIVMETEVRGCGCRGLGRTEALVSETRAVQVELGPLLLAEELPRLLDASLVIIQLHVSDGIVQLHLTDGANLVVQVRHLGGRLGEWRRWRLLLLLSHRLLEARDASTGSDLSLSGLLEPRQLLRRLLCSLGRSAAWGARSRLVRSAEEIESS